MALASGSLDRAAATWPSQGRWRRPWRSERAPPIAMMASRRRKASIWRARSGVSDNQRQQRRGQIFRRAILLQEFRHDVLAEHQIGQDHARQPRPQPDQPGDRWPRQVQAIGRDHRHAGERQFEGHGARRGQGGAGAAKRRPFLGRLNHDARRHGPVRPPPPSWRQQCGTVGITTSIAPTCAARRPSASPNIPGSRRISLERLPGSASTSGGSASRRAASCGIGPQLGDALDQRMADIGAGRTAELAWIAGSNGRIASTWST